ncbi:MAG: TldD/PmbA family protein [Thermoplasmata archaeon]
MTTSDSDDLIGFRVADRLRTAAPWEVYGERVRRYEIHFQGRMLEAIRGPLLVEGFGVRIFRAHDDQTGVGFQASTDSSDAGIAATLKDAEQIAVHSNFPTKRVDLPSDGNSGPVGEVRDEHLWNAPIARLEEYVTGLLGPFDSIHASVPSFGSVRATLAEVSIANSSGLRASYPHTQVALELAVKSFGGAEGAAPGEFWVNESFRRVDPAHAGDRVAEWCRYAQDARRAAPPPTGELPVVLPPAIVEGILPLVLGYRLSGAGRLRQISPSEGSAIASPLISIHDDGRYPWGILSGPVDEEGTPRGHRTLVKAGTTTELVYDVLHGGAFELPSSGNAARGLDFGPGDWIRFRHRPTVAPTTLVVDPGTGGTDAELIEAAGDGIWVQQLGWPAPDPISGGFGGEIRIGYRIRNGKLAEPVRGGTVGGVVFAPPGAPSMLGGVAAVGSHAELTGTLSAPSLLVKNLTVAGGA